MDVEEAGTGPRDPLLVPTPGGRRLCRDGGGDGQGEWQRNVVVEVKRQLWLAGPLIVSSLLHYSLIVTSLIFVGHLGKLPMAGASMATSFAGVTGYSLLLGMGSAMDTFCGQAFGAGQHHMLGVHMQRAMLILTLVSIPLAFAWAYTGDILMAVGQDPEISREAGVYARWMIPSLFAYGLLQCHARFLQTQNVVLPVMLSSAIASLLHVLTCWILVFKIGLGTKGAALAICISLWVNVSLLAIFVRTSSSCKKSWIGFSREAFRDVVSFIRLAVPSAVMICLEFWSFECLVLLSGLLPNPTLETSVLSICLNTSAVIFKFPFSFGNVVSTRVSNELGAGHPQAARLAVVVVLFLTLMEGSLMVVATVLVRRIWGYLYSTDEEVVKYVAAMLPVLAVSNFIDGIQCVLSGVLRGCGRQKIGAYVNLGAYYIVGIPSSVLFAFILHIGGKGLWFGIICGLSVQVLFFMGIMVRTNWEKEERNSKHRLQSSGIPVGEVS